jgi:hypothetical protein
LISCASQKGPAYEMIHAYYQVRIPGMIQSGVEEEIIADTIPVIFVQASRVPLISAIWMGSKSYSAKPIELNKFPHQVGIDISTGNSIELTPASGKKIYFIDTKKNVRPGKPPLIIKPGEILLTGESDGKTFHQIISDPVQLASTRFK